MSKGNAKGHNGGNGASALKQTPRNQPAHSKQSGDSGRGTVTKVELSTAKV